jgi:hypothetical protein
MSARRFVLLSTLALFTSVALAQSASSTAPVWPTPDHFWFRTTVPGGFEWWHVDARHGLRERLFDHNRLAIELNQKSGGSYSARTLPFADPGAGFVVKYDGSNAALQEGALAIEFTLADDRWRCELQGEWDWGRTPPSDYYCEPEGATGGGPRPVDVPVRSPDGKWEASVADYNVTVRAVGGAARPLSTDGSATAPYEPGSIRWSSDSRTVGAYRVEAEVWKSAPGAGGVAARISKQEWRVGAPQLPR